MTRERIARAALLAALSFSALAGGTAHAAIATYPGSGLAILNNQTLTSTTTVPAGRPPVLDVDVAFTTMTVNGSGGDQTFRLRNPAGTERTVIGAENCSDHAGVSFVLDQEAPPTFGGLNCPLQSGLRYHPVPAAAAPLRGLLAGASSPGAWTLTWDDDGSVNPGGGINGALAGWGLQLTHAPLDCTEAASKQKLRKRLRFTVSCNGDATLTPSGDVKASPIPISAGQGFSASAKLKPKALDRLEERGKAKIGGVLSNDLGDSDSLSLRIKLKR